MVENKQINSLLKEADLYEKQGLLEQSRQKYKDIIPLIKKDKELSKNKEFIKTFKTKMSNVARKLDEVEKETEPPEISEDVQKLISNLFSFSKNKSVAAIEGAVALAKFGQYEKAIASFQKLINEGDLPIMAATNMLRCHLNLASSDAAVSQMNKWISHDTFSKSELKYLSDFLLNLLQKEGIQPDLLPVDDVSDQKEKKVGNAEDILEISSIRIILEDNNLVEKNVDLDITFQLGNDISFIIKENDKKMLDILKPGTRLSKIQCYSPVSLFIAKGKISNMKKITDGPKTGDYNFDLTIEGV